MRDHEPDLTALGLRVAAVGTGDAAYARELEQRLRLSFPLLIDPTLRSYGAAGARRGSPLRVLHPRTAVAALRNVGATGMRQGRTGRHPFQLGATHVIGPDGSVPFAWVNDDYADNAPMAEVLAVVR
ncbi:MAG TPA: AhpC/TSA family protein, partial [Egibacteraceae bacterium]|nr:AhpC/TSA family protein [Egibacteraceae bacterium]